MNALHDIGVRVEGVWFPRDEQHLRDLMSGPEDSKGVYRKEGRITYQWECQERAMDLVSDIMPSYRKGVFVDVGGHCGFWGMWWGRDMAGLIAYEPIQLHRRLYEANCRDNGVNWNNCALVPHAVSDRDAQVIMKFNPSNTGASRIVEGKAPTLFPPIPAETVKLDTNLPSYIATAPVTVIKIDAEGFEERVIRGALNIIRQHKPFIIVEERQDNRLIEQTEGGAVALLMRNGYRKVGQVRGDYFMAFE